MGERVGLTYALRDETTYILIANENYRPGIGDILYVRIGSGYVLLQVSGFEGEVPAAATSFLARESSSHYSYNVEKTLLVKAVPLFEIRDVRLGNHVKRVVVRPSQPPPLDTPAYPLRVGDEESEFIMKVLSDEIPKNKDNAVPIAWLRAGIASARELMSEKYFRSASLKLNLKDMISKHVLISGQTGSGKTTSVMGILTQWSRFTNDPTSWIIADRHGEYSTSRKFIDVLSKALKLNDKLADSHKNIYIYVLKTGVEKFSRSEEEAIVKRFEGGFDTASVSIYDVINAAGLSEKDADDLLEITSILVNLIKIASETQTPQHGEYNTLRKTHETEEHRISKSCVKAFIRDEESDEPTGNLLALIPLITSNVIRYEGVGESEKKGIYKVFVNAGIYANKLRYFRKLILSVFEWREKLESILVGNKKVTVSVIDDKNSVFKVSPMLKDPLSLITILKALVNSAVKISGGVKGSYPWFSVEGSELSSLTPDSLDLSEVARKLDEGAIVILDVSKLPLSLGDMVVMSVLRRIFEKRMHEGVEESKKKPVVAVVSEEAPLYLSPEKVTSPYNIFARLAREGRKFGIGLIALSQIATMIDRQILANFNTLIVLRTKHRADIEYMSDVGVPAETLPGLSDREGYLYTPDLSVSEPIPVYFPAYFDYSDEIDDEFSKLVRLGDLDSKLVKTLFGRVSEDEDSRG